MAKLSYRLL